MMVVVATAPATATNRASLGTDAMGVADMTTLQEAARDALEALERIGKDFVCRSAHHAKKD